MPRLRPLRDSGQERSCGAVGFPGRFAAFARERLMAARSGRHFLQIPGPTNVPDRILRAIDNPTIDHRGPEFAELAKGCLAGIKTIFQTVDPVIIYTASGTGGWEAALVNTLSPGDKLLASDTGQFAALWIKMARNLGFEID